MPEAGLLLEVRWEYGGSRIVLDAAAGAQVVTVEDASVFTEGEHVWFGADDGPYAVTTVDEANQTLTLGSALSEALVEMDPVALDVGGQAGRVWIADCLMPDAEEPIEVVLTVHDLTVMPEGVYDPPVDILLSDDLASVVDLPGQPPRISGEYVPPETLPITPEEPPFAPTLATQGMPRGIMLQVTNGRPGWTYSVTVTDTNDESTPDVTQTYPDTQRSVMYWEAMPDGTPFSATSNGYVFQVTASNEAGTATSAPTELQPLVLNDSSSISELAVGKLVSGDLVGAFALLGALQVGNNIEITPESGIVIRTPLGDTVLPADGQTPIFRGSAIFDALTAQGNLKIEGVTNEVSKGSSIYLASSVTAPKVGPTITPEWPGKAIHRGYNNRSLALHQFTGLYYQVESILDNAVQVTAVQNTVDGFKYLFGKQVNIRGSQDSGGGGAWGAGALRHGSGGVAIHQDEMYVLGQVSGGTGKAWYVYRGRYDGAKWVYVDRWQYEPTDYLGENSYYSPTIGIDSTTGNVLIGQCGQNGDLNICTYTPAGARLSRWRVNKADGTKWKVAANMRSLGRGNFDFGSKRTFAFWENSPKVYFWTDDEMSQRDLDADFFVPPEARPPEGETDSSFRAVMYDSTANRFRSAQSFWAFEHSKIQTSVIHAVQTLRNSAVGYETPMSKARIVTTFPKRAYAQISGTLETIAAGEQNAPDSIALYISQNSTVNRTEFFQITPLLPPGGTTQVIDELPVAGPNPPLASTFPRAIPATILSADSDDAGALSVIRGDGSGRVGPFAWDSTGKRVWVPTMNESWRTVGQGNEPVKFQNGWGSATAEPVQFRKDFLGSVYIRGRISKGTDNTTAFTLPVGYRPSVTLRYNVLAASGFDPVVVTISTSGAVSVDWNSGSATLINFTLPPFDVY